MDELREHFEDLLESDQNDPQVQFEIGQCYREGRGVEKDARLAEKWLTRAAQQGHQEAKRLLEAGKAPKKTVDQEITAENLPRWCVRAEDGDPDAQYKVAVYLRHHGGSKRDMRRYLEDAAEQGHPEACGLLGKDLLGGTPAEAARGVEYLRNAADCNVIPAMRLLGACYAEGRGVPQDPAQAERYYLKAAERGGPGMKLDMAVRYAVGDGVAESQTKAMAWVQRAQDGGLRNAQQQFEGQVKSRKQEQERLAAQRAKDREREARWAAQEADRKREEEKERQREQADAEKFKDWDRWMPPVLAVFTWLSASIPLGYGLTMTRIPFLRQMAARVLIPPVLWWLRWNEESLMWALYALIFFVGAKIVETGNKRADVSRSKFLAWFQRHGVLLYILIFCVSLAYLTCMAFALK